MRRMGPLSEDHPCVTKEEKCPACKNPFFAGEYVTLIAIGPGDNEKARHNRDEGRAYNAVALVVHWDCAPR